jgi:hypothetical protein
MGQPIPPVIEPGGSPSLGAPTYSTEPSPQTSQEVPGRPISRKRLLWAGVVGAAVVVAGSGAIGYALGQTAGRSAAEEENAAAASASAAASAAAADARLSNAYKSCSSTDTAKTLELGDGGNSLIVDTRSKYTSMAGVACILGRLKTPTSITSSIDHTTSLMGERSAESAGLSYSWSYHPDNGLNLVITNGK